MLSLPVYDQLKPTLDHTLWPSSPDFDFVTRSMPGKRGHNGMFEQYRALMQRVRAAKTSAWLSRGWWRLERVRVCRVPSFAVLSASLGRASPWCVARPGIRHCILGLIGQMAGCVAPGVSAGATFAVAAGDLAALGCGATMKKARKTQAAQAFRGGDGSFASLASTRFAGLVVRVVAVERALDESALAASLLTNMFFTLPRALFISSTALVEIYPGFAFIG